MANKVLRISIEKLGAGFFMCQGQVTAVPGARRCSVVRLGQLQKSNLEVAPENPLPFSDLVLTGVNEVKKGIFQD